MTSVEVSDLLGPELAGALSRRGYLELTPVQEAVLNPQLSERDLRISSQTGSGKTVAIGFTLRAVVGAPSKAVRGVARPRALVVTPTRELAKQVEAELAWLYAPKVRVASVTGGASFTIEHRALAAGPAILVGTPGRLLDHLRRQSIDASNLGAVVLDEADRMLDLGFREDLEAILALTPEGRRTHLVSATFARDVQALADRVQHDAVHVEGTPLGSANTDIRHVVHLVAPRERVDALVNLLLADPEAQTLVFARTRADVARVADELDRAGFAVDSLSGDMDQPARNRALSAFKRGDLHVLVATDVAARGIDHHNIARVIQLDPPTDPDMYTHRSGRTGRAGRKGTSSILVPPSALPRLSALLRRAGVVFRIEPIPSAEALAAAQDEQLFQELTGERAEPLDEDPRVASIARRIAESGHSARALTRLIALTRGAAGLGERRQRVLAAPRKLTPVDSGKQHRAKPHSDGAKPHSDTWTAFRVSWGEVHGADARRLLAMLCRRGNIRGSDIGAIRLAPTHSVVEVASSVAEAFERATRDPDPRDPRVSVRRERALSRAAPRKLPATLEFTTKPPRAGHLPPKKRRS